LSKTADGVGLAADFHVVSLTAKTTFVNDVGEPLIKYNWN